MLTNPYGKLPNAAQNSGTVRIQTDIPIGEKSLLVGLFPQRDAFQLIINNLLKNICDELRELNHTTYRPDSSTLLAQLCARRPLPPGLRQEQPGSTHPSPNQPLSKGLLDSRGGAEIPSGTPNTPSERPSVPQQAGGRKRTDRAKNPTNQKTNPA